MNISKLILTLLTMVVLVLGPSVASAEDFTFDATDGDWNSPENWLEDGGPPRTGDRATIPNGKTCRLQTADQAAYVVSVQSGGKLVIESKKLLLDEVGSLAVDGTLELNNTASAPGHLAWVGGLHISGSGTIDCGDGLISPDSGSGDLAIGTVGEAPTIKGSVSIAPAGDCLVGLSRPSCGASSTMLPRERG